VARTDVTITTEDGVCAAGLHTPAATGSWPAVIMYPDAGGARATFADMADTLAGFGYTVLVPDVYYRQDWAPFDITTVFTDPDERKRLRDLASDLTPERQRADAGAFLDFLASREEVAGARVGTTGYCMGGRMSLTAAANYPDRVGAAASFHGGNLAPQDDPVGVHRLADRILARVYVAAAQNDRSFPPDQQTRLEQAFAASNLTYTLETYPADHGFAVPDNLTYDRAAAERHWAALRDLYATLR
jgi:carboxymethylenebutenolidase